MWLMDQMAPGNPAYNLPRALRLRGPLEVAALEAAINIVIQRHEILRTTYAAEGGEPRARIHPALTIRVALTSVEHLPTEEREAKAHALATEESLRPFDLSQLPLIRVALFKLGPADHILFVNVHHIAADGLSMGLLLDEVDAAYRGALSGREPDLPVLSLQYGDFAHWQRESWADDATHASQIAYWRERLGGDLPVVELTGDRPRPAVRSYLGSHVYFRLPAEVGEGVRALVRRERCTGFMVLLAAFQVLLARYTGLSDLVIGTPIGARESQALEPLIGNFLTMAGLRCDLSGSPSFLDVLRRGRDATLEALMNPVPLMVVMRHLAIERSADRNPVFQVLFEMPRVPSTRLGELEVTPFNFDLGFAQFDLSLHVHDEGDGYLARFEYSTDVFDRETVERIATAFTELVRHAVARPEQAVADLAMFTGPERQRILAAGTGAATDLPDLPMHALVEAQAVRTPERVALRTASTALTYAELDARAEKIARALRARGAGRGQRIGVCLERTCDLPVALLGILKTGAAYVPLDPAYPAQRLRFMAEDAEISLLVSAEPLAGWCGLPRERQLLLGIEPIDGPPGPGDRPGAADPAYVIYTSGSTGTPKGVVVGHGAAANLLMSMAQAPGIGANDVLLAVTTVSFDIALLELFLPLCVGATVVLATRDEARDGQALRALLERHGVTVMQATPITWRLLLEAGWEVRSPFKALVGGEALPRDLATALLAQGVELWNMYGPTETTVWSTCARIRDAARITIGRPIANTVVRVLDPRRQLCPIGVPGELCIGGSGLALEYWKRPELTAERFVSDPEGAAGARLYRTGDRARLLGDGNLEHLGRLDDQVKLRGFRIELRGIEANIMRHPGIREATVVVRSNPTGEARLIAFLAVDSGAGAVTEDLRTALRTELPEYMIPAQFVVLDALPRTANGKVDRRALPDPELEVRAGTAAAEAHTPNEALVLKIFREVLRRPDAGMDDNFFELGGDSLMAARLVIRLRGACGSDVPLGLLFERQTAAGLAEAIEMFAVAGGEPPARADGAIETGERVEVEL